MNLKQAILKEHSRAQVNKIIAYVGNDHERFDNLITVFFEGPYLVTQRAGWPISYCVEQNPEMIRPYLKRILDHLKKPGIHDSVKRNTMRLLQFIVVPTRYHGKVAEVCFQYLLNKKEPVAIRAFALTVLGDIAKVNPDLRNELKIIIEDNLPMAKPAFLSRARKVLKEMNL